jgi:CRISPR/Cas system-associated exonuclease Cas4 (RecB family)
MGKIPNTQFSQNSLQDYVNCPRRFQLRYVLRQPWPAVPSEPLGEYERLIERGQRFHQLVQRHSLGMTQDELGKTIHDPDLRRWWQDYLVSPPPNLPSAVRRAEVTLSTPLAGSPGRLVARYDLLAVDPGQPAVSPAKGRAVIVDWKTNQKRPSSATLAARLQTRVYRYVLVEAGSALNGGQPLSPDQVTMIYWFAQHPARPEILPYDAAQHAHDAAYLADQIARIAAHAASGEREWPLTPNEQHCRFCTYRSLCDRGILPGPLSDFDADQALDLGLEFEFEEVEEIEY